MIARIVGGILMILLFGGFVLWMDGFFKKLRYLNDEIRRTEGREQAHYKKDADSFGYLCFRFMVKGDKRTAPSAIF